ncbi:MAG: DNA methylase, partial [Staphylothermus sp.]|nr:DNA methylase [Staphylothermus sp.]
PYFNIIKYSSKSSLEGDLSRYRKLIDYLRGLKQVLEEIYRVLKPGHYMGILVGDTRIRRHYVPLTHYVLELILQTGFILKEEIVKIQHKMKTTREFWQKIKERDYLLIYHEKLFIARKPKAMNEYKIYKYSTKQEYTSI